MLGSILFKKEWLNVKIGYGSDRNRKITDLELFSIY
jgi:hypothetical protein